MIQDSRGFDLLQGAGLNRDRTAAEEAVIVYASTSLHPYVDETDTLRLKVDNQAAPSAELTIDLYIALGA